MTTAPKETIAQRIKWAMERRGLNKNQLEVAAGVSEGYLTNAYRRNSDQVKPETLRKLAGALPANMGWLATGEGEHGVPEGKSPHAASEEAREADQPTPHTPPAKSGSRPTLRQLVERIPQQIEDWFAEVLQDLGGRRYSKDQVRAAKGFLAWFEFRVGPAGPRKVVLGALEAAKKLDEAGQSMDYDAMMVLWGEGFAPESGPVPGDDSAERTAREKRTAEIEAEKKAMKRSGHIPPDRSKRRPS